MAKASRIVTVTCHSCQHFCLKNIADVHKPLVIYELVVAQLVEHWTHNPKLKGYDPAAIAEREKNYF